MTAKGLLNNVEDFKNIVVTTDSNGGIVRLKDVARIELGADSYNMVAHFDNAPAVIIGLSQTPNSNSLNIMNDVKKEIEATLAAKKSEQMIMSLMPVGIILYLQMTSPGFLSVLYGNPFGIAAMSICLVIYAAAYWLGRRIVDIEV